MKVPSISGTCKNIYHNGSYLLLFGKRWWQSFKYYLNFKFCFHYWVFMCNITLLRFTFLCYQPKITRKQSRKNFNHLSNFLICFLMKRNKFPSMFGNKCLHALVRESDVSWWFTLTKLLDERCSENFCFPSWYFSCSLPVRLFAIIFFPIRIQIIWCYRSK